jgi:hypothetical protein
MVYWLCAVTWAFYASWEALASAGVAKAPDNSCWWLALIFLTLAVDAGLKAIREARDNG